MNVFAVSDDIVYFMYSVEDRPIHKRGGLKAISLL